MLTTDQVLMRLTEEGITENIQVVRRWIRNGELPAQAPAKRKDGYLVREADLATFIEQKRKKQKLTPDEYETEIQQLKEALKQSQEENIRLRNELDRSEERYAVLSGDLHDALDKLANNKKEGMVNWKHKYDEAIKLGKEKANRLNQVLQEIDILKNPEKYEVTKKSIPAPTTPEESGGFTERFQCEGKKYEVRVWVKNGRYVMRWYSGWGRSIKPLVVDKSSAIFKHFIKNVRNRRSGEIATALESIEQLVPSDEVKL